MKTHYFAHEISTKELKRRNDIIIVIPMNSPEADCVTEIFNITAHNSGVYGLNYSAYETMGYCSINGSYLLTHVCVAFCIGYRPPKATHILSTDSIKQLLEILEEGKRNGYSVKDALDKITLDLYSV